MCENVDKAIHLKTLITEIKILYAQWRKAREKGTPVKAPIISPWLPSK